jgi:hypothetical protein
MSLLFSSRDIQKGKNACDPGDIDILGILRYNGT